MHDGLSSPLVFAPCGGLARLAAVGSSALVSSRRASARSRPLLTITILTRRHQRRADDAMAAGPKQPLTTLPRAFFSHMPRMLSHTHERVLCVCVCVRWAHSIASGSWRSRQSSTRRRSRGSRSSRRFVSPHFDPPPPFPPPLVKAFCLIPCAPHICRTPHSRLLSADVFFNQLTN